MNKKLIISIAWIISLIISFYLGKTAEWLDHSFKPEILTDAILSSDYKKSIWIKKQVWGMTNDHQVIYLTKDELSKAPNLSKDIVFDKSETIFYKAENDTLHIYSGYNYKINPKTFDGFYIKCHVLENPEFADLYKQVHTNIKTTDWM